jgi:hypothetical protein
MEKGVRISEREYSKKMAELNRGFEVCAASHLFRLTDALLDCGQFVRGNGKSNE